MPSSTTSVEPSPVTLKLLKLPESRVSCARASRPVDGIDPDADDRFGAHAGAGEPEGVAGDPPGAGAGVDHAVGHVSVAVEHLPQPASRLQHQRDDPPPAGRHAEPGQSESRSRRPGCCRGPCRRSRRPSPGTPSRCRSPAGRPGASRRRPRTWRRRSSGSAAARPGPRRGRSPTGPSRSRRRSGSAGRGSTRGRRPRWRPRARGASRCRLRPGGRPSRCSPRCRSCG